MKQHVEAREGLVDWNIRFIFSIKEYSVEAREGLVDWNVLFVGNSGYQCVEAREGLVDWNISTKSHPKSSRSSRPARALWIEIPEIVSVALLVMSRPARALWIEIGSDATLPSVYPVEAREGLVDWNFIKIAIFRLLFCRGPRGPCGLKCLWMKVIPGYIGRGPRGPCGLKFFVPFNHLLPVSRGPRGPCGLK